MHPHELPLPLLIRLQARSGAVPAAGKGVIAGQGFEPVDLPVRGIVAVPAASPAFMVEDAGGLDLIRITPNWPEKAP